MEYTVRFTRLDGTTDERKFTLIPVTTLRARALLKRMWNISDGHVELNVDFIESMMEKPEELNSIMSQLLVGNHDGISWIDCDFKTFDEVLAGFFTESLRKISESTVSQESME